MKKVLIVLAVFLIGCSNEFNQNDLEKILEKCKNNGGLSIFRIPPNANMRTVTCENGAIFYLY